MGRLVKSQCDEKRREEPRCSGVYSELSDLYQVICDSCEGTGGRVKSLLDYADDLWAQGVSRDVIVRETIVRLSYYRNRKAPDEYLEYLNATSKRRALASRVPTNFREASESRLWRGRLLG